VPGSVYLVNDMKKIKVVDYFGWQSIFEISLTEYMKDNKFVLYKFIFSHILCVCVCVCVCVCAYMHAGVFYNLKNVHEIIHNLPMCNILCCFLL
jgi:hypothetical protein